MNYPSTLTVDDLPDIYDSDIPELAKAQLTCVVINWNERHHEGMRDRIRFALGMLRTAAMCGAQWGNV